MTGEQRAWVQAFIDGKQALLDEAVVVVQEAREAGEPQGVTDRLSCAVEDLALSIEALQNRLDGTC